MKRSYFVLAGTAAGVAAVVSYHATSKSPLTLAAGSANAVARTAHHRSSTSTAKLPPSRTAASRTTTSQTTSGTTTSRRSTTTHSSSAASAPATPKSAVGQAVSYQYGQLQVKVTESGGKITGVALLELNVPDPQSGSIDQQAVPMLRAQVLSAQSAKIDGISGASFTSAAYRQSVQSAIDKLG